MARKPTSTLPPPPEGPGLFGAEDLALKAAVPAPQPLPKATPTSKGPQEPIWALGRPLEASDTPGSPYFLPGATTVLLGHERCREGFEAEAVSIGPGGEVLHRTTYKADTILHAEAGALRRFMDGHRDGSVFHLVSQSNEVVGQLTVNLPTWGRCGLLAALNSESFFDQPTRAFWLRVLISMQKHSWKFIPPSSLDSKRSGQNLNDSIQAAS